jgi:outer membrane receptor protein involved in Fe transport
VLVRDQTGRLVAKTMHINQDYAKVQGAELGLQAQATPALRFFTNVAYQVARGKSNSARESALQIEQNGEVALSREQFLAWDRPWNVNLGTVWAPKKGAWRGFEVFAQSSYTSGYRYTPQLLVGVNDLGRPQFQVLNDQLLSKIGAPWWNTDLKASYTLRPNKKRDAGATFTVDMRNLFDNRNSQVINPITGRAYEYGDDVPNTWRDPRPEYNGPQESGLDPRDPSRFSAPRQILFGVTFKF